MEAERAEADTMEHAVDYSNRSWHENDTSKAIAFGGDQSQLAT